MQLVRAGVLLLSAPWAAAHLDTREARSRPRRLRVPTPASNSSGRRLSWFEDALAYLGSRGASLLGGVDITMFGTTFTEDNYGRDQLRFLLAGMRDDDGVGVQEWYLEGTGESQIVPGATRQGPGPNTVTHLGYDDVRQLLGSFGDKIEQGRLERGNELGMQVLGDGAWPEAPGGLKSIALGQTVDNHAFLRPYLANALDKGRGDDVAACDGSACWSEAWLKAEARSFFAGRVETRSSDVTWWVVKLLHKIHLNIDLTENEAKEFADYMRGIFKLIPFPGEVLQQRLAGAALGAEGTLRAKAAYLERFKAAVRVKYAGEAFVATGDEAKVELLASAILDSVQFAGGVSVPTVIRNVLALTHMAEAGRPEALRGLALGAENYDWVLLETLRKYAPVQGVPSWERQEDGSFRHVIPNLAQALMDSTVFPEPFRFENRGMPLYESRVLGPGLPWAGPAVHRADTAAPHSHNCPAQQLSFKMIRAFLEAFIERGAVELAGSTGWSAVDSSSIRIRRLAGPSEFTLLRRGHEQKTGCAFRPRCDDGYAWESTSRCRFGRREWTCRVQ